MSTPSTTNQAATVVNNILQNIIEGSGVSVVEAAILIDVPWLGLPIIKQVFEYFLNFVASYIYVDAANTATKIVIDIQVNAEESVVISNFQELQQAIASGDQNAISKASSDLDSAYGSIIHSDGSAPA